MVLWQAREEAEVQVHPYADGGSKDNLGFEHRQVPRLYITLALMLSGMGMPASQHPDGARASGGLVHADTITRILGNTVPYSEAVEQYTETLKPPCGDRWGCDEKHQKVGGRESYIVAVMDLATGSYWRGMSCHQGETTTPPPCCGGPGKWRARFPGCSLPTAWTSTI